MERPGTSLMSRRSEGNKSARAAGAVVETFASTEPFALSAMNMRPAQSNGPSMGKMIGRLFKKQSTDLELSTGPGAAGTGLGLNGTVSQRINGAEAMLGGQARNLEVCFPPFFALIIV